MTNPALRSPHYLSGLTRIAIVLLMAALLGGCALNKIEREMEEARELGLISGSVSSLEGTENVHVLLWMKGSEGPTILGVETWGYNDDHMTILTSEEPVARFLEILEAAASEI